MLKTAPAQTTTQISHVDSVIQVTLDRKKAPNPLHLSPVHCVHVPVAQGSVTQRMAPALTVARDLRVTTVNDANLELITLLIVLAAFQDTLA